MSIWVIALKALVGGLAVAGFSLLGQSGHPKRFSGLWPGCWGPGASTSCSGQAGSSSSRTSCCPSALAKVAADRDRLPVDAILENHAIAVGGEVGGEEAGAIPVTLLGEPFVALIESPHVQRWKPKPRGRHRPGFADL